MKSNVIFKRSVSYDLKKNDSPLSDLDKWKLNNPHIQEQPYGNKWEIVDSQLEQSLNSIYNLPYYDTIDEAWKQVWKYKNEFDKVNKEMNRLNLIFQKDEDELCLVRGEFRDSDGYYRDFI